MHFVAQERGSKGQFNIARFASSVNIIPDIYELRNCNYLKVILQIGLYITLKD